MQTMLYFTSILLTGALAGFLAFYAWRQRGVPGSLAYAGLALGECLLALAEILSMLSPTPALALFWFQIRYLCLAVIPIFWLVFALAYSGRKNFISKRLLAGLFIVPVITQVLLWSNSLHGLWVKQEVGFHQSGPFWLAETGARLPALGFLAHVFYSLILLLAGIALFLIAAWRVRRLYRRQALLLASAGFTAFVFAVNSIFNLIPQPEFNLFTPGLGLSVLLIALAVFRFQFLKHTPAADSGAKTRLLARQTQRSLAVFLLIFILMATGMAAVGYLSYQNYERQFRAQVESQLASIAELKVRELETWRTERLADAEVMRQNPTFAALAARCLANPADTQAQAQMQAWLDVLRGLYHYDRVFLLDAAGVERISSPAAPEPVAAHLTQKAAAILSAGQVTFLDFHRDTATGPIHLALLVPILAQQDSRRPLGLLVLRIDPAVYLYPFIQQWPAPSASAETLLIRREGTDALFLNELRFQANTALTLRIPLENTQVLAVKAALGQAGIVEGLDYRGAPAIGVIRAVPDSPWFLVARMDTAEVVAPLRERLWQTVVFFSALLAAAGAGLGLVWRQQRARYYRGQLETLAALRVSEEKFRLAFSTSPDSIAITRQADGMFVSVNKGFEQISGYTQAEVIGKTSTEINIWKNPEDRRKVVEGLRATGEVQNYEAPFLTRTGEIYGLMSAAVIQLQGEPHILNITRDITARQQAEEALRESEQRFREFFERQTNYCYRISPDGKILDLNSSALRALGYASKDDIVGQPLLTTVYAPASRDRARQLFLQWKETGELRNEELSIITQSGEERSIILNVSAVKDPTGKLLYSVSIQTDITARKWDEEALRESEDKFKYVFDHSLIGKSITLPSGEISVNKAFCDMLGCTPEELQTRRWQDITHPDDIELTQRALDPLLSGEQDSVRFTKRYIHKNGAIVWADVGTSLRRDKAGKPLYFMTAISDITARQRAEEEIRQLNATLEQRVVERTTQLEAANKELEAFAYSVSHDLRAPLRAMDGFSRILLDDYAAELTVEAQRYLGLVRRSAQEMGQLIDDLLSFSRLSRQPLNKQGVEPAQLVRQALDVLSSQQEGRPVEISIGDLPPCEADPALLKLVFVNLIGNALKYTRRREAAVIEIGGIPDPSGEACAFFVKDNGVGFDMKYAHKLFGVFQRLHRAEDYEGTGVGLATVQRIIHRHGGRVWAEASLDQGATFYFTLKGEVLHD